MMKNLLKIFMLVTIMFSPFDLLVNSEEVEKINEEVAAADTTNTDEIIDTNEPVSNETGSNDESEVALADSNEVASADTTNTDEIIDTNEPVSNETGSNDESEVALADSDDIPAVSASVIEDTNTLNTIENISIDVENGVGIVTITTSFVASYEEIDKESNKYSLKLTNVVLDDRLQVARDLSDFDTPLNFTFKFSILIS
jgi:hypothetical protein